MTPTTDADALENAKALLVDLGCEVTRLEEKIERLYDELHAIKYEVMGGEDVPGSVHAATIEDIKREIDRLRSTSQARVPEGWIIETGRSEKLYLSSFSIGDAVHTGFSPDRADAIRFARERDANYCAENLLGEDHDYQSIPLSASPTPPQTADHGALREAPAEESESRLLDACQRNLALRVAMTQAVRIITTNLYHQREKVEDATSILRAALASSPTPAATEIREGLFQATAEPAVVEGSVIGALDLVAFASEMADTLWQAEGGDIDNVSLQETMVSFGLIQYRKPTEAEIGDHEWWGHEYGIGPESCGVGEFTPAFKALRKAHHGLGDRTNVSTGRSVGLNQALPAATDAVAVEPCAHTMLSNDGNSTMCCDCGKIIRGTDGGQL